MVKELLPTMHKTNVANQAKAINLQKNDKRERESNKNVLTVHAPVHKVS